MKSEVSPKLIKRNFKKGDLVIFENKSVHDYIVLITNTDEGTNVFDGVLLHSKEVANPQPVTTAKKSDYILFEGELIISN